MTTETLLTAFGAMIVLLLTLAGFLFNRWMEDLRASIALMCQSNEKEHGEIWDRLHKHGHRIRAENGGYETAGVIVEPTR